MDLAPYALSSLTDRECEEFMDKFDDVFKKPKELSDEEFDDLIKLLKENLNEPEPIPIFDSETNELSSNRNFKVNKKFDINNKPPYTKTFEIAVHGPKTQNLRIVSLSNFETTLRMMHERNLHTKTPRQILDHMLFESDIDFNKNHPPFKEELKESKLGKFISDTELQHITPEIYCTDEESRRLFFKSDNQLQIVQILQTLNYNFRRQQSTLTNMLTESDALFKEDHLSRLSPVEFYREGGSGIILKGTNLRKPVCVKIYTSEKYGAEQKLMVARREALISEVMGDYNAIPIMLDSGEVTINTFSESYTLPYIITQYVGDRSLSEQRELDGDDMRIFLDQTSSALQALHKQGFAHRDLHGENIRVSDPNQNHDKKHYHILDVEGARKIGSPDDNYTLTTTTGGRHTVAPELLERKLNGKIGIKPYMVTQSLDVYGLGVVAYYAATGYYPYSETYDGAPRDDIQEKIYNNVPVTRINLMREQKGLTPIAPQLEQLIHQMMGPLEQRPTMKTVQEQVKGMQ